MSCWIVDGQKQPRPAEAQIDILDSVGLDRRMTPQPLVLEHDSMTPFYVAGGWVATVPADLEGGA